MTPQKKATVQSIGIDPHEHIKLLLQRLPKPISTMRLHGNRLLENLLDAFFSETDDILFELAKTAIKQQDQDDFFSAMREIRTHRSQVKKEFIEGLNAAYSALSKPSEQTDSISGVQLPVSADDLTLIDHDDMDELIAKESLAARAFSANSKVLRELTLRVNSVVLAEVHEQNLPVSPATLCDLFVRAVHTIRISTKATLVLFKVFENKLLSQLGLLYEQQNRILKERGILPKIEHRKVTERRKPAVASAPSGGLDQPIDPDLAALLNDSIATAFAAETPTSRLPSSHAVNPTPQTKSYQSVYALDRIAQHRDFEGIQSECEEQQDLTHLVERAVNRFGQKYRPNRHEESVIQLVDQVFNNLCEPYAINHPLKELIAKLQLITARVALHDDQFFDDASHQGRALINTLTDAILRCDIKNPNSPHDDPLYNTLYRILHQLHQQPEPQLDSFSEILKAIEQHQNNEQRRAQTVEKRLLSAEYGRLRHEDALTLVNTTLAESCFDVELPPQIHEMIYSGWRQVMVYIALRHGGQSKQWQRVVAVLDNLVTLTKIDVSTQNREEVRHNAEKIKRALKKGLQLIHFDIFTMDKLFADLEIALADLLKGATPKQQPNVTEKVQPPQPPSQQNADEKDDLIERKAVDQIFINQAKNLSNGAWFNIKQDEGYVRCRLAAVFDEYSRYIFVNRLGIKISDLHQTEVASMLQEQNLVPMDSNQIFEKALEDVISSIKQSR